MQDLAGRTAFITGAARGIGLGIARALARAGVRLALADLDEDALQAANDELSGVVDVRTYVLDVTDREHYAHVAAAVADELGSVALLFNNAGIADSVGPTKLTYKMWDHVVGVNLDGVYNGIQTFVPSMLKLNVPCHVVNTASEAGLIMGGSGFLYHASKFAVVGLSEALRAELEPFGIGVSVLCPGPVATDIVNNTRRVRPAGAPAHSERTTAIMAAAHSVLMQGVPADAVGALVVDAVRANRPYIFTRAEGADAIAQRNSALLNVMREDQRSLDQLLNEAESAESKT